MKLHFLVVFLAIICFSKEGRNVKMALQNGCLVSRNIINTRLLVLVSVTSFSCILFLLCFFCFWSAFPFWCAWGCANNCRCNHWERWGMRFSYLLRYSLSRIQHMVQQVIVLKLGEVGGKHDSMSWAVKLRLRIKRQGPCSFWVFKTWFA